MPQVVETRLPTGLRWVADAGMVPHTGEGPGHRIGGQGTAASGGQEGGLIAGGGWQSVAGVAVGAQRGTQVRAEWSDAGLVAT